MTKQRAFLFYALYLNLRCVSKLTHFLNHEGWQHCYLDCSVTPVMALCFRQYSNLCYVPSHEGIWRSPGIAVRILNLGLRRWWANKDLASISTARKPPPPSRYTFSSSHSWPQSRLGHRNSIDKTVCACRELKADLSVRSPANVLISFSRLFLFTYSNNLFSIDKFSSVSYSVILSLWRRQAL